jgi:arsenate reductase
LTRVRFVCVQNADGGGALLVAGRGGARNAFGWDLSRRRIHPEVVDTMRELGIDLTGGAPRRLTDGDARWADLVVTMGWGDECPVLPGKRYLDWPLDDPAGRSPEQVRATRDEIARRVDALLEGL